MNSESGSQHCGVTCGNTVIWYALSDKTVRANYRILANPYITTDKNIGSDPCSVTNFDTLIIDSKGLIHDGDISI